VGEERGWFTASSPRFVMYQQLPCFHSLSALPGSGLALALFHKMMLPDPADKLWRLVLIIIDQPTDCWFFSASFQYPNTVFIMSHVQIILHSLSYLGILYPGGAFPFLFCNECSIEAFAPEGFDADYPGRYAQYFIVQELPTPIFMYFECMGVSDRSHMLFPGNEIEFGVYLCETTEVSKNPLNVGRT
jgi:hypothetical protein